MYLQAGSTPSPARICVYILHRTQRTRPHVCSQWSYNIVILQRDPGRRTWGSLCITSAWESVNEDSLFLEHPLTCDLDVPTCIISVSLGYTMTSKSSIKGLPGVPPSWNACSVIERVCLYWHIDYHIILAKLRNTATPLPAHPGFEFEFPRIHKYTEVQVVQIHARTAADVVRHMHRICIAAF